MLEGIKAEMAAIRADPELSEEEKRLQAENKMRSLYAASGSAKVKGAVAQVERALQEGKSPVVDMLLTVILHQILSIATIHLCWLAVAALHTQSSDSQRHWGRWESFYR